MSRSSLSILNIGLDRDLLSRDGQTEAQARQALYVRSLPARIVHLVKTSQEIPAKQFELGPNLVIVPCPVKHWTQFVPLAIHRGIELLRKERFDFIQVQEPFVSGIAGAILAGRFRLPLVVGLYSDEIDNPIWLAERPLNRLANWSAKWVLRRAAATRSDSIAVVERLKRYRYHHLTYVPFLITHANLLATPVSESSFVRARLLAGQEGPLLLAVCRLEPEKNIPLMLAALAKAVQQRPGLVLAIAGHGSLSDSLMAEAERIAPGRVRWLGRIDNTEMSLYYQAADLMLLSSDRESAARVLFESLLAGTPVLSTDTAGAREAIEDGVSGRIVPVGDIGSFTRALTELCSNPTHLTVMGQEGRRRMKLRVTGDAIVQQLRELYDKALGQAA